MGQQGGLVGTGGDVNINTHWCVCINIPHTGLDWRDRGRNSIKYAGMMWWILWCYNGLAGLNACYYFIINYNQAFLVKTSPHSSVSGMWLSGAWDSKINSAEITVGKYKVLVTISELQNINFISKTNFNNLPPSITHSDHEQIWVSSGEERDSSWGTCQYLGWCWQSAWEGVRLTETKVLVVQIMSV